jgi:hypothetical protein
MADVTFRDFAGAIMGNDTAAAGRTLEQLLGLDAAAATAAALHFQQQMAQSPAFMMKAMGLRTAVGSGDEGQVRQVLADCFALGGPALDGAVLAALRQRSG